MNVLTKCVLARGGIQIEEGLTDRERKREGMMTWTWTEGVTARG